MGSKDLYPEERPIHRVTVDGFWMDKLPVTTTDVRRFVRETGYLTVAERSRLATGSGARFDDSQGSSE
jgi:formylglycine-generating enzyme required for sulfatase activity